MSGIIQKIHRVTLLQSIIVLHQLQFPVQALPYLSWEIEMAQKPCKQRFSCIQRGIKALADLCFQKLLPAGRISPCPKILIYRFDLVDPEIQFGLFFLFFLFLRFPQKLQRPFIRFPKLPEALRIILRIRNPELLHIGRLDRPLVGQTVQLQYMIYQFPLHG